MPVPDRACPENLLSGIYNDASGIQCFLDSGLRWNESFRIFCGRINHLRFIQYSLYLFVKREYGTFFINSRPHVAATESKQTAIWVFY